MQYKFNQSVHFHGVDYMRGQVYDVPEKVEYSPHFIKYVGLGLIVAHEPQIVSTESLMDRNKRFHDALVKRAAESKAPKKAPEAPKAPEKTQEEKDAEELEKMEADEAAAKADAEKADAEQAEEKASDQGGAPEKAEKAEKAEKKKNKKG